MADLPVVLTGGIGNKKVVANGNSQSNSYYKAPGIRLIAKEPRRTPLTEKCKE